MTRYYIHFWNDVTVHAFLVGLRLRVCRHSAQVVHVLTLGSTRWSVGSKVLIFSPPTSVIVQDKVWMMAGVRSPVRDRTSQLR